MSANKPLCIAHRGASGHAPENTLAAFRAAIDMGADMIELDTHLSADGKLIVMHDGKVERTTNGTGAIAEMNASEIVKLDAGGHYGDKFAGEPVPLLDQVVELCQGKIQINIELKGTNEDVGKLEETVLNLLREAKFVDQVIISAFKHRRLTVMKQMEPSIKIAKLFVGRPSWLTGAGYFSNMAAMHPHWTGATAAFVNKSHANNCAVNVWTVNTAARMQALAQKGVDGFITNYPDIYHQAFK